MARIRSIKPEFFHHKGLASTSPHARLLAIGLLTLADSEGRLLWIEMQVHAQVFPWERKVNTQVLLDELARVDYVKTYSIGGKDYVEIVNFLKHQRLSGKESKMKSRLPGPNENIGEIPGSNSEVSGCFPGKYLDAQGTGEQGNRGTGEQVVAFSPVPKKQIAIPEGVDTQVWRDWLLVRKEQKKGPPTETALKRIGTQAAKLNWTIGEAIEYSASKGWIGFESDWVKDNRNGQLKSKSFESEYKPMPPRPIQ